MNIVLGVAKKNPQKPVSVISMINAIKRTFKKGKYSLKLVSDTDYLNFITYIHRQKAVRPGASHLPESV